MIFDPAVLTPRQRSVYDLLQRNHNYRAIAAKTGLLYDNVVGAASEIRALQAKAARGVAMDPATARKNAEAIDARLAALPVCGLCSLRGSHVCTGRAADIAQLRQFDPCDL